jgi:hypothetical protein
VVSQKYLKVICKKPGIWCSTEYHLCTLPNSKIHCQCQVWGSPFNSIALLLDTLCSHPCLNFPVIPKHACMLWYQTASWRYRLSKFTPAQFHMNLTGQRQPELMSDDFSLTLPCDCSDSLSHLHGRGSFPVWLCQIRL